MVTTPVYIFNALIIICLALLIGCCIHAAQLVSCALISPCLLQRRRLPVLFGRALNIVSFPKPSVFAGEIHSGLKRTLPEFGLIVSICRSLLQYIP